MRHRRISLHQSTFPMWKGTTCGEIKPTEGLVYVQGYETGETNSGVESRVELGFSKDSPIVEMSKKKSGDRRE